MKITHFQLKHLISETIKNILSERKFDPRTLDQMNFSSLSKMILYVKDKLGLMPLGQGSARTVFLLDSKRVLKIAMNAKGLAQNEAEIKLSLNLVADTVIAKIFDYQKDNKWLISELVRPLKSEAEFKELTGVSFAFITYLMYIKSEFRHEAIEHIKESINYGATHYRDYAKTAKELETQTKIPIFAHILRVVDDPQINLVLADINKVDHWGKTPDQRVVLLDYGFTEEVEARYY